MSSCEPDFKQLGNTEFRNGAYLKAAALYTRGLKADPGNAVLLSNRCACLLKLHKLDKALADAQECVRVRGDWDKSHFRLGSALEALGRQAEAFAAFKRARDCNPENAEAAAKLQTVRGSSKDSAAPAHRAGAGAPAPAGTAANGSSHAPAVAAGGGGGSSVSNGKRLPAAQVTAKVTTAEEYEEAKAAMVAGEAHAYSEERVLRFADEVRLATAEQLAHAAAGGPAGYPVGGRGGPAGDSAGSAHAAEAGSAPEELQPCVYFLPGRRSGDQVEQWGQVRVAAAFESPDTLQSALAFLREYAADTGAHAACAVVSRGNIAFPQVWKKRGWPLGSADGAFVQLESRGLRRVWFVRPGSDAYELPEDFKLLEPLFR
ncbi:hypothetical protein WJX81_001084 [Elliptochloris bilobata]|uniref:Uncharacterized protein n=1 Tax=Elliptochloris bilobata TaxID=381761 RepID=A0AAW1S630_9CHLO